MQFVFEIIISFFLIFGAFFMLVGSIGMIRLPDLFMRLHAPTKSSTLGLGSFLIAAMVLFPVEYSMIQSDINSVSSFPFPVCWCNLYPKKSMKNLISFVCQNSLKGIFISK